MTRREIGYNEYNRFEEIFENLYTYIYELAKKNLAYSMENHVEELDRSITMGVIQFEIADGEVTNAFIILVDFPHKYSVIKKTVEKTVEDDYWIYEAAIIKIMDKENNVSGLITNTCTSCEPFEFKFLIPQPPRNIMDTIFTSPHAKTSPNIGVLRKLVSSTSSREGALLIGYIAKKKRYYDVITLVLTHHEVQLTYTLRSPRAFWKKYRTRDLAYALSLLNPEAVTGTYYCSSMMPLDIPSALMFVENKIYDEALRVISFYEIMQREADLRKR